LPLRIVLWGFVVFMVLEAVMSLVVWRSFESKKTFILNHNVNTVLDVYHSTNQGYGKIMKLLYDEIINTPAIISIFKQAQSPDTSIRSRARKHLYEALLPAYRSLSSINLQQMHFHLPDTTSFLRFHRPHKYGDSLAGVRYSVLVANRDKVPVEGFEEGRIYNGFRYVYPLFDTQGKHIGSVETSLASNALSSDIENVTGFFVDFIVKKTVVEKKVWEKERKHYFQSELSPEYLHEQESGKWLKRSRVFHSTNIAIAREAAVRMRQNRPFALYDKGCIVAFIPIANVQGEPGAAYLVSYDKTNAIGNIINSTFITWGVSSAALLLIVILGLQLYQKISQIKEMALRDALTGLYNRSSLTEHIETEMARHRRMGTPFSLIYLDVDDFKKINDLYGHKSGDSALRTLAALLLENMRAIDSTGRWGGEEFLICLPDTDLQHALTVAEKLRARIEATDFELPVGVTASFGVAGYRRHESLDSVIARADESLYRAKESGKNRVCCMED
jgi:diguanylate cyclase (GGDEF)-like protein